LTRPRSVRPYDPRDAGALDGDCGRLDQIENRRVGARPAVPFGDRARRIARHDDRFDAVLVEAFEIRVQQLQQLGMGSIAVRHVRLIGKVDDIGRRQPFANARENRETS